MSARRQNVTKQMATEAARKAVQDTWGRVPRRAYIWYDNPRDGWSWDYEDSEWLGYRHNNQPKTDKLIEVRP